MENNIPPIVVCETEQCAMAAQCSRYQKYMEERRQSLVLQILNTSLLEVSEEGCKYLHIAREVTAARGFSKMYGTIPRGCAKNVWQDFPLNISRRQFYRLMNGEVQILPEEQAEVLTYFKSLGADTSLGFDAYEQVTV